MAVKPWIGALVAPS